MNDDAWVTVTIYAVINGHECFYSSIVRREMWQYPEAQLALLKSLKAKMLDRALAGLEPRVTVYDGARAMPVGPGMEWVSDGSGYHCTVEAK